MKKSDLKDGMRVILRNGIEFIVAGHMIDNMDTWDNLESYNEDLTSIEFRKLDIVEVYGWERIPGEFPRRKKVKMWERPLEPQKGNVYFKPELDNDDKYSSHTWLDRDVDILLHKRGLIFKTKTEAIECANKMLEAVKNEIKE